MYDRFKLTSPERTVERVTLSPPIFIFWENGGCNSFWKWYLQSPDFKGGAPDVEHSTCPDDRQPFWKQFWPGVSDSHSDTHTIFQKTRTHPLSFSRTLNAILSEFNQLGVFSDAIVLLHTALPPAPNVSHMGKCKLKQRKQSFAYFLIHTVLFSFFLSCSGLCTTIWGAYRADCLFLMSALSQLNFHG